MRVFTLFVCLLFIAPSAFAQKFSFLKRVFSARKAVEAPVKAPKVPLPNVAAVEVAVRPVKLPKVVPPHVWRAPVVSALTPEIKAVVPHYTSARTALISEVGKVHPAEAHIGASLLEAHNIFTGALIGSGFVVRSGSGRLYAVLSYHVVGGVGGMVHLRLFNEKGESRDYDRLFVSAAGAFGINSPDSSIVELPQDAAGFVKPLHLAKQAPKVGDKLAAWGSPYAVQGLARLDSLRLVNDEGLKLTMQSEHTPFKLDGFCGSPVLNEAGEVVGIIDGFNHDAYHYFAANARFTLPWLIGNYEQNMIPMLEYKLNGRTVFWVSSGESVGEVRLLNARGKVKEKVYLPGYPLPFDPAKLEALFPQAQAGDALELDILRHREVFRTVTVDIERP